MTITQGDIAAIGDVLTEFTNGIEDLTVEDAIHFTAAIVEVQKAAKLAVELLKTRTLNLIEKQPVVVDGTIYARKAERKWRPDQRKIQSAVAMRAVYDLQTGEKVEEPVVAAANAVLLMYDLFVAPSEFPKQVGLKKLNLTNEDVGTHEVTGHSLKTMELEPSDD